MLNKVSDNFLHRRNHKKAQTYSAQYQQVEPFKPPNYNPDVYFLSTLSNSLSMQSLFAQIPLLNSANNFPLKFQ
jgi:hypothetical protein